MESSRSATDFRTSSSMPLLRIIDADGTHVHPLDDETVTIGRGPGNKIILKDLASSSRHAQVLKDGAGWRLEDRGSLNGTFINGAQVQKKQLVPGDRIQIGSTEIVFELGLAPQLPDTRLAPPQRDVPAAKPPASPGYATSFLQSMVGDDVEASSAVVNPFMQSLVIDDESEPDEGGSRFAFLRADGGSIEEDVRTMMFATQMRAPGSSGSALLPTQSGRNVGRREAAHDSANQRKAGAHFRSEPVDERNYDHRHRKHRRRSGRVVLAR